MVHPESFPHQQSMTSPGSQRCLNCGGRGHRFSECSSPEEALQCVKALIELLEGAGVHNPAPVYGLLDSRRPLISLVRLCCMQLASCMCVRVCARACVCVCVTARGRSKAQCCKLQVGHELVVHKAQFPLTSGQRSTIGLDLSAAITQPGRPRCLACGGRGHAAPACPTKEVLEGLQLLRDLLAS